MAENEGCINHYLIEYQICKANEVGTHKEEFVKLINDSYWLQQEPFFIDSLDSRERISIAKWDEILLDPTQMVYVLQDTTTKRLAGVIVLEIPPYREYAKFGMFAISKAHQGKKLGQILIGYVEQVARTLLKKFMKIEILTFAHRLETYYQKLGYVNTGRTNSFFHGKYIKHEYRNETLQYLKELEKKL